MRWEEIFAEWNPWHGCTKISPGCKYCYVYRQDEMFGAEGKSSEVHRNADFNVPVRRKRDKSYKIPPGKVVFTCFTSDFLLEEADQWRTEAWAMIRERSDLTFFFFTKRITRFADCMPDDWGDGGKMLTGETMKASSASGPLALMTGGIALTFIYLVYLARNRVPPVVTHSSSMGI